MESLGEVWRRLLFLFRRRQFDRDLEEEMRFHAEMTGKAQFGNALLLREEAREAWGWMWAERLAQDARHALRGMRKSPGFATVVILTLALGIGVTTAIFTVVNGVLLRPLPYPQPGQLVAIKVDLRRGAASNVIPFSYTRDYATWKAGAKTLSGIAGYMRFAANFWAGGEGERVECALATESLFPLLGAQPILGRRFLPEEDRPGGPPVALLSHRFWQTHFGGDRAVTGRTVTLDGASYTVVGVLPAGFRVPDRYGSDNSYDVWLPFAIGERGQARRGEILMQTMGRLRPGITIPAVRAELQALMQAGAPKRPASRAVVVTSWHEEITGGVRRSLILFLFAVGFVLLIACVNVANLLLSRATSRGREMAVRRALGAGRGRVVRQLLTESVMLGLAGGILGLVLAFWVKNLLLAFISPNLPTLDPIGLDYRVMAFNFAIALLTGIAFGLAPGIQASQMQFNDFLKDAGRSLTEGRSSSRVRNALVIFEMALAVVLLCGAGLLLKSFVRLRGIDPGFRCDHMLTWEADLASSRYPKAADQARYFEQVLDRIVRLPGVQSAAGGSALPLSGFSFSEHGGIKVEGQPLVEGEISMIIVSPDYFRAMEIPLLRGRSFTDLDRQGSPGVAMVNESFARQFLAGDAGVGTRIENPERKGEWLTIAGVVSNTRPDPLKEAAPELYRPYSQSPYSHVTFVLRSTADPMRLVAPVRREMATVDKTQPPYDIQSLDTLRTRMFVPRRVNTLLIGFFACLALALGSIGIYGVMAFSIGRRTHEIGVRMALGARQNEILGMVLRKGLVLIGSGVALGLAASAVLTRLIANQLWGISATDPWTFAAVTLLLTASGIAACLLPARRASRVDPMRALRYE